MRLLKPFAAASLSLLCAGAAQAQSCAAMSTGQGASLNGFVPFSTASLWNQNIATASVDPDSSAIINKIGASVGLHPDFGAGLYAGSTIGIPYEVVSNQALVKIAFNAYGSESDPGPMPIPASAPIEGYPKPGTGDRHVLVLDRDNCWLYELYGSYPKSDGSWVAASAAVWDLLGNEQRPYTWTSADAAGLPVFVGLARYDEVAAGAIHHALRFTLPSSRQAFVPPASHWASSSTDTTLAPMGARLRLKSSFDTSKFPPQAQVILTALKQYGMILADNGSAMYISGAPDDRWNNSDLATLGQVPASAFEVLSLSPLYTSSNVPTGPKPTINSFTASATTISAGQSVTLNWSVGSSAYNIVTPGVGVTRGATATVTPTATTTYTLDATNAYGRTRKTVKITVQ